VNRYIAWGALIPLGLASYLVYQRVDKDTGIFILAAATCAAAIIAILPIYVQKRAGGESEGSSAQPRPASSNQLTRDIADFTGRDSEQRTIRDALEQAARGKGTAVVISAINGMAGVGKSALAIHVAHQVKKRFPDGLLYVDLRGAEGTPLDPALALAGFIQALDATAALPESQAERESKYRSLLTGKRVLIVLDNAHDEKQVRPLLPGNPPSAVLITSRQPLSTLEGATYLKVEVMSERDALDLLGKLAGADRVAREPDAARDLVRLCGCLPLAVRITGARLGVPNAPSLAQQAAALGEERQRLENLKLHDLDVRASFTLSYRDLDTASARLFHLLGFLRGPDFSGEVAAPLLALEPGEAGRALSDLVDAQLLEPIGDDRYREHDLLRLFSQERLNEDESSDERKAALQRVARWYVDWTGAANDLFSPERRRHAAAAVAPESDEPIDQIGQSLLLGALGWFDRERETVRGIMEMAAEQGVWEPLPRLAANLANYFSLRAMWREWEDSQQLALDAAHKVNDRQAESVTLNNLGIVYRSQGRTEEALAAWRDALAKLHPDSPEYQYLRKQLDPQGEDGEPGSDQ
jgi:tetratricopeptide (TPR) repeat protein